MVATSFKVHSSCLGWPLWSSTPGAVKPSYVTGTACHTDLPVLYSNKTQRVSFCVRDFLQPTDHFKYTLNVLTIAPYVLTH